MLKPIVLKNLTIQNPVALGPMAGVTDAAFRALCQKEGCGLFYTEMVSAKALYYKNKNTDELLDRGDDEFPLGVQLFGSDPDIIAEEALKIEERFDFIDFNMGCPVPKVVKNGEGSFLLTQPELTEHILTKLCRTVSKPVTVKMRKAFLEDGEIAVEIAKIAEASGVSMLSVHGRSREQYYRGKADRDAIREIKEAVRIPVIGNGDIFSAEDAINMISETHADGIMIGRGAQGNPWIFREIEAGLKGEPIPERPTENEIIEKILEHARLLMGLKGEKTAIPEMRKHASWYLAGTQNAALKRRLLNEANSMEELEKILRNSAL